MSGRYRQVPGKWSLHSSEYQLVSIYRLILDKWSLLNGAIRVDCTGRCPLKGLSR
jgi:hypothetical protein